MGDRIFASLDVKDIFPTPVWVADLAPDRAAALNAQLKRDILALTAPRREIPLGTNWQTEQVLHLRPEFADFTELTRKAAKGALDFLKITYSSFDITGCWANINPQGGLNSLHTHPNNFLSGVYYVSLPQGAGELVFSDPRPQAAMILPPTANWNKYVGNEIRLAVQEGRFVLFPSWLLHSVPINRTPHERISIAFNVMFANFTEEMSKPLWKPTATLKG